jgi:hypothetical protein
MKAGDPGLPMFMWQRWAVMSQALPKLPHYSKHLPCFIVLLKKVLTPSLSKYTTGRFSRNRPRPPDAFQEKALGGHLLSAVRTHWSSGTREDALEASLGPLCPEDSNVS